uniref:Uncharacterized protein n=1 Tax=viral metagenome TaxID=1070528 RepID=A0A6C0JT33_9ZZZZ
MGGSYPKSAYLKMNPSFYFPEASYTFSDIEKTPWYSGETDEKGPVCIEASSSLLVSLSRVDLTREGQVETPIELVEGTNPKLGNIRNRCTIIPCDSDRTTYYTLEESFDTDPGLKSEVYTRVNISGDLTQSSVDLKKTDATRPICAVFTEATVEKTDLPYSTTKEDVVEFLRHVTWVVVYGFKPELSYDDLGTDLDFLELRGSLNGRSSAHIKRLSCTEDSFTKMKSRSIDINKITQLELLGPERKMNRLGINKGKPTLFSSRIPELDVLVASCQKDFSHLHEVVKKGRVPGVLVIDSDYERKGGLTRIPVDTLPITVGGNYPITALDVIALCKSYGTYVICKSPRGRINFESVLASYVDEIQFTDYIRTISLLNIHLSNVTTITFPFNDPRQTYQIILRIRVRERGSRMKSGCK